MQNAAPHYWAYCPAKTIKGLVLYFTLLSLLSAPLSVNAEEGKTGSHSSHATEQRIITLGGAITETVYALGAGGGIIAVDSSSIYPPATNEVADVGYYRQISAEGVLSLSPTLIIASSEAGPTNAVAQLEMAGIKYSKIDQMKTPNGVRALVAAVGQAIKKEAEADELIEQIAHDFQQVADFTENAEKFPATMIIHARGPGALHVAGLQTSADTVIELAGGKNCAAFEGFRPLTEEGLLILQPEVVVLMAPGFSEKQALVSLQGHKGLKLTPAGKNNRIHVMDGLYLLGFGPRQGKATMDLAKLIHPELVTVGNTDITEEGAATGE